MAFLDVGRHDGANLGRVAPDTGFTIIISMAVTETQSVTRFDVQADDLWPVGLRTPRRISHVRL